MPYNISKHSKNDGYSPYFVMTGTHFDIAFLQEFGVPAYVHLEKQQRRKLDSHVRAGIYIGYCFEDRCHEVFIPATKRVVHAKRVHFGVIGTAPRILNPSVDVDDNEDDEDLLTTTLNDLMEQSSTAPPQSPQPQSPSTTNVVGVDVDADGWDPLQDDYNDDAATAGEFSHSHVSAVTSSSTDPRGMKQAMESIDSEEWKQGIVAEMTAMHQLGVFEEATDISATTRPVRSHFIFHRKRDANGDVLKHKVRLVADGNHQSDIDYDEVFSTTVTIDSIRTILAISMQRGWIIRQGDISNAYLNADLDREMFLQLPQGNGLFDDGQVVRLRKAIYGLKQSGRLWNNTIDVFFREELKLVRCESDTCVYRSTQLDLIVAVYVDDLIVTGAAIDVVNTFEQQVSTKFPMKPFGEIGLLLGMQCKLTGDTLTLNQSHYVESILEEFGMHKSKPSSTPMNPGYKDMPLGDNETMSEKPYRRVIGKLLYASTRTRPDIATAVSILSRHLSAPSEKHWKAAMFLLRYLRGTTNYELAYTSNGANLTGYSDASFMSDKTSSRSRTGFVLLVGGAPIVWGTHLEKTIALSTAEVEYMGLSRCAREVLFIRQLCAELNGAEESTLDATLVFTDNQAAQQVATMSASRMRHVRVRYHFIRSCVTNGDIALSYCPTEEMIADMFTKPLPPAFVKKFTQCCSATKWCVLFVTFIVLLFVDVHNCTTMYVYYGLTMQCICVILRCHYRSGVAGECWNRC